MGSGMRQTPTMNRDMVKNEALLEIKDLVISFKMRQGLVKAVNGVSFRLDRGKVLGVVGESGSGKSVTARSLLRIESPGNLEAGEINFKSKLGRLQIHKISPRSDLIRTVRWNEISMIFQEPMSSFGPMHTFGNQIAEVLMLHKKLNKRQALEQAIENLASVGMPRPEKLVNQYPHQISGGMRQRAMIAMALSCNPSLLIADEPTTALDVSTESQILALLSEKQKELNTSILYISHNLEVVANIADEVIVMYLGNIVEHAPANELFNNPRHPYTIDLLNSIPRIQENYKGKKLEELIGSIPDPYKHPPGCKYHPRCRKFIKGLCDVKTPVLIPVSENIKVSCHLYSEPDVKTDRDESA